MYCKRLGFLTMEVLAGAALLLVACDECKNTDDCSMFEVCANGMCQTAVQPPNTDTDVPTDIDTNPDTDTDIQDTAEEDAGPAPSTNLWVTLEGGTFMMGNDENDDLGWTKPEHEVTLDTFDIMISEVTINQYKACVIADVCTEPLTAASGVCNWSALKTRLFYPVNCVSHSQANTFCKWVGGRLPSESEWEYAAQSGGKGYRYPWGNDDAKCDHAVMATDENGVSCNSKEIEPVCRRPNGNTEQNLCDMGGNVWEWVADWFFGTYQGAPADGTAWTGSGENDEWVIRGGSGGSTAERLTTRRRFYVRGGFADVGFRCAR